MGLCGDLQGPLAASLAEKAQSLPRLIVSVPSAGHVSLVSGVKKARY